MAQPKKRADGRYCTRIYLGRDETTQKPRYKSIYANSLPALKVKEAEVRHQLGKGLDILSQRDSFSVWANDFLRLKEAADITDRQKEKYRHAVKVWSNEFDGLEIGQIRADDVERVLLSLQEAGYSTSTISFYRNTIRLIMRRAVGRVISVNPVDLVELTKPGKSGETRRALTDEEQRWIWDTPGRGQSVAVIMMLSGLRRGELAALTWDDVDLKERTITVNKTIEYLSDRTSHLRNFPKTSASARVIDIPRKLCSYLSGMDRSNTLVIPSAKGTVMTESAWTKLWSSYMRTLNKKYGSGIQKHQDEPGRPGPKTYEMTIPHFTLHWLRHTFCTIMYLAGVDVITASKQMGHADVATTLRIYTHLDAVYKRKNVNKMDRYLKTVNF